MAASAEREVVFDLGGCLEDLVPVQDNSPTPVVQVVILDETAIVNMFRPDFADIFLFTIQVLLPYITTQLHHVSRLVVWDEHLADSLKAEARTRRGKCIRRRVSLHWQQQYRVFNLWRLVQQPLPLTNKSSAHITLMCPEIYKALLHALMKKQIHESYSTWRMLWNTGMTRYPFAQLLILLMPVCSLGA